MPSPSSDRRSSRVAVFDEKALAFPNAHRTRSFFYVSVLDCSRYFDFRARRHHAKLRELAAAQRALPIDAFERAIVDEVRSARGVCLVAGDTGCGKSTQVRACRESSRVAIDVWCAADEGPGASLCPTTLGMNVLHTARRPRRRRCCN